MFRVSREYYVKCETFLWNDIYDMDEIRSKLYMNLIELKSSLEMYYWSVIFNNIVSNAEKKLSTQSRGKQLKSYILFSSRNITFHLSDSIRIFSK